VVMVGAIVITIVATAGMTSTTYVQFIKGALLVVFSTVLVVVVLIRGFNPAPDQGGKVPFVEPATLQATLAADEVVLLDSTLVVLESTTVKKAHFLRIAGPAGEGWWHVEDAAEDGSVRLSEAQWEAKSADGTHLINGLPASEDNNLRQVGNVIQVAGRTGPEAVSGPVGPLRYLGLMSDPNTVVRRWKDVSFTAESGAKLKVIYPLETTGNRIMRPGLKFKVEGTPLERLDFVSLMLALFFGTAALPHILIRYYTVPSPMSARKSTIVAIAAIGAFYVLTLYMGLGAMTSGVVNPLDNNMSAPLLARSFGELLFAIISAIAFSTVLGTVSGLIIAASGAVAHDLMDRYAGRNMNEKQKVRAGKTAAFAVGILAIILGILFKGMNVSFLVGLAFAVAASANLPAILMMLFWKRTSAKGITAGITVGILSSVGLILFSPSMYEKYGLDPTLAPFPLDNPGVISIPLSFLVLIVVSLLTTRTTTGVEQ
jgi:cation/acetate symporter